MEVTHYGHACLDVRTQGMRVLIDPGNLSQEPPLSGVDALVLTHAHADHADIDVARRVHQESPQAVLLAPPDLAALWQGDGLPVEAVRPGTAAAIGTVVLAFSGGEHALVHRDLPVVDNVGVLVDGLLYHPGDSFDLPDGAVGLLAAPVSGPWLKIGEVMDFVAEARAELVLPIHEAHNSEVGQRMALTRLSHVVAEYGGRLLTPEVGEPVRV
ncbi:MBL fold metallo-hydrolase [Ruania alba]|uniref:L-ascorbate metabolism protein UlaG, beta-lactamase superfamily n=1 Tax=Ruania alba TaxID=648782 RepID=A0A1H5MGJ7_9MICO|nr:MBL fold metallo-hydrolase [Ruania alba]SEE88434.1 L-ascorbate metabolism protein UlaG, beta-lactamase superfamily [Ruania alba]